MILSMSGQAWIFLACVALGFAVGFKYDLVRVFRRVVRHRNFAVQIEDGLFWVMAALAVFYFLLRQNFGEVRAFAVAGVIIGMGLYFAVMLLIGGIGENEIGMLPWGKQISAALKRSGMM